MVSWNMCEACKLNALVKVDMGACQQSICEDREEQYKWEDWEWEFGVSFLALASIDYN